MTFLIPLPLEQPHAVLEDFDPACAVFSCVQTMVWLCRCWCTLRLHKGQSVQHRMKDRVCTAGRATRAQELCESRGGLPGLPVPNSPYGLCGRRAAVKRIQISKVRSCVKEDMEVLASPSLIVLNMVSVDVKQHWTWTTLTELRSCVKVEVAILGSPSLIVRRVSVLTWTTFTELRSCVNVVVVILGSPSLIVYSL